MMGKDVLIVNYVYIIALLKLTFNMRKITFEL
jgi:hypothetical protein